MNESPFNIVGDRKVAAGQAVEEVDRDGDIGERIRRLIATGSVFLFMKGTPGMPQCGFSANVVAILNSLGVEFKSFDILTDMDIRQGVKELSGWPTFPQLYVKGRLVGGNDVVTELYEEGELPSVLGQS